MVDFDKYIRERVVYYDPDYTMDDIIAKLAKEEWDILAFRDNITVKRNKNVPLVYRDVITNIKAEDGLIFLVIDGINYPARDDTKIISALTPFKTIFLKVISDRKNINVTFTRLLMKNSIINDLRKEIVYDANFTYHGGELI